MELRCYLCDAEIKSDAKPFRVGIREELVCTSCYTKTVNRRAALDKEKAG